ncbi:MAG: MaoC family dehydratase [Novosphingobium sp.]
MQDEVDRFIQSELGKTYVSDWLEVDQAMIQAFADTTRDWNFLHVDPEAAARTEYGGTIAHGFLALSLLAPLRQDLPRPRFPGLRMGVNYGLERVRFVQPVPSGRRVRGHFTVTAIAPADPGRFREELDFSVEVEGADRPALVGRWLTMYFL